MLRDVDLSDTPEDLGSADLSEMRSLLESTDHTRVDDEDYTATPSGDIKVDFGCEYAVGRKVLEPRIDPEVTSFFLLCLLHGQACRFFIRHSRYHVETTMYYKTNFIIYYFVNFFCLDWCTYL